MVRSSCVMLLGSLLFSGFVLQTPALAFPQAADSTQSDRERAQPDSSSAAPGVVALRVEQARVRHDTLRVFFDARDGADRPMSDVHARQLTATVGHDIVPVDTVRSYTEAGDGTAYLVLLDVSRSLRARRFEQVRAAVRTWARALGPADRLALVTFGEEVRLVADFSADSTALRDTLAALAPTDDRTRFHDGLLRALDLTRQTGAGLPPRRVIVTLSDGVDDVLGGATRQEVLDALHVDPVPIYAIGLDEPPVSEEERGGLQALGEYARVSGGAFFRAGSQRLDTLLATVHRRIRTVQVADLDCASCPADGNVYRLQLAVAAAGRRLTDGLDLRLHAVHTARAPTQEVALVPWYRSWSRSWYLWGVAALAAVLAVGFVVGRRRRRAGAAPLPVPPPSATPVAPPAEAPRRAEPAPAAVGATRPVRSSVRPLSLRLTPLAPHAAESRTVALTERTTIGRSPERAGVAFAEEQSLSGVHCALVRQGEAVFVEDLGSTNGTSVNGVPITGRHRLQDGDLLRLGSLELRLRFPGGIP